MSFNNTSDHPTNVLLSGICTYQKINVNTLTQVQLSSNLLQYENYYYKVLKFTTQKRDTDIRFQINGTKNYDTVFISSLSGKEIGLNQMASDYKPKKTLKKGRAYLIVFRFSKVTLKVINIIISSPNKGGIKTQEKKVFKLPLAASSWLDTEQSIASFQI